jgi:hypothetical protein
LFRNLFADQISRPFHKREFVRPAAFEKHTDARMPERISCGDQSVIGRYLQVRLVAGFGQDEEFAGDRTLDCMEFPAKVLDKHFMQPLIDLSRFPPMSLKHSSSLFVIWDETNSRGSSATARYVGIITGEWA